MDSLDREILAHLRLDGRLSTRRLGTLVHLSAPAVAARVHRLEETGVIAGYTIKVQVPRRAARISTFVDVIMKSQDHAAFARFIAQRPDVRECYRTCGDTCYLLKVETIDHESLNCFLDELLRYANYRTHTVISTLVEREDESDI